MVDVPRCPTFLRSTCLAPTPPPPLGRREMYKRASTTGLHVGDVLNKHQHHLDTLISRSLHSWYHLLPPDCRITDNNSLPAILLHLIKNMCDTLWSFLISYTFTVLQKKCIIYKYNFYCLISRYNKKFIGTGKWSKWLMKLLVQEK